MFQCFDGKFWISVDKWEGFYILEYNFWLILVHKHTDLIFLANRQKWWKLQCFHVRFKFYAPCFQRNSAFHCQLSTLLHFCHNSFRVAFLSAEGRGKSELGHRHINSHMYLYKCLCAYEKFGTNSISGVSESINLQILYFLVIQVVVCISSYIPH